MTSLLKLLYNGTLLALLLTPSGTPAQSLWREDTSKSMLSDNRAHAVGDILTILVQQSNTATKDNSTSAGNRTNSSTEASSVTR